MSSFTQNLPGYMIGVCILVALSLCQIEWACAEDQPAMDPATDQTAPVELQAAPQIYTLREVIETALKNYPAMAAAQARVEANQGQVDLARTSYLPRLDLQWQSNRATRNNSAGLFFPGNVILPISGPVIENANGGTAWGSAAGAMLSWQPFDFGLRQADMMAAQAQVQAALAGKKLTEFQVMSLVTDSFFKVVTAKAAVQVEDANVNRSMVFRDFVKGLVKSGLRPGSDLSRANAELALAATNQAQAKANLTIGLSMLAQLMGDTRETIAIEAKPFYQLPDDSAPFGLDSIDNHPELIVERAKLNVIDAKADSLTHAYAPKVNLLTGIYGRGSGVDTNGTLRGGGTGLVPTRLNAAIGATVTFNVFDLPGIRAQEKTVNAQRKEESALVQQLVLQLQSQDAQARAVLEAAKQVVALTPVQLDMAQDNEQQIQARYRAGLATVVDVADAQRLLTQSEVANSLSHINFWHALFGEAMAHGNLSTFLNLVDLQGGAK